jgi:proton-translocating NAD(P)+ transhydrogenase subunit alpha
LHARARTIHIPKESYPGERRVALVPGVLASLAKAGLQVMVEAGAGESAGYPTVIGIPSAS